MTKLVIKILRNFFYEPLSQIISRGPFVIFVDFLPEVPYRIDKHCFCQRFPIEYINIEDNPL